METHSTTPNSMVSNIWRNRSLTIALAKREVIGRYKGSFLGILWSFFNPIFMLLVYTFVFGSVFKSRWGGGAGSTSEFALILFAGMNVFSVFSECISRAPGLITGNANYVKKVVFPLEIIPVVTLVSALFHMVVSTAVWIIFYALIIGIPHVSVLLLPLVIAPLALFCLGVSWMLASLGVYLRDISQIVGVAITALMFMSPIFYPVTSFPETYRWILYLNPLTIVIEQARQVMMWGEFPELMTWLVCVLISAIIACLGFAWFQKTRKGFADVI